jgi:protein-S-isoprenylcysteine O-methyltransferase Ste14
MNAQMLLQNCILIGGMLAIWGGVHSLTASLSSKLLAQRWLGERTCDGWYRLLYNVFALVSFLPVLWGLTRLPDQTLYRLPGWAWWLCVPLQVVALLCAGLTLWRVDLWRFVGLRQWVRWLSGEPEPRTPAVFYVSGFYRWVRHPLYFFSLILLWCTPLLSVNTLFFNLFCTLYFYVGSIFEERKLVQEFGQVYLDYQKQVPRLLPMPFGKRDG